MSRLKAFLRKDSVFGTGPRARSDTGSPEGDSAKLIDGALTTVLLLLNSFSNEYPTSPTKVMTALRRLTQQLIHLQLYTDALDFHSIALCRLEALAHRSPAQVVYDMPLALATQALLLRLSGRNDNARGAIRRAIPIAEELIGDNGKAMTAVCFEVMAWVDDYSLETAAYLERAIAIYWHLIARYPSRYLVKYLENLSLLGKVMLDAGDPFRAIAVLKHAILFWQYLDRPHHQPIKERILTHLNEAFRSVGKGHTASAVVPHSKDVVNARGGACRRTRRLFICCRRKNTSIDSTDGSCGRFCSRISSVLDIIRALRSANDSPPHKKVPTHFSGKGEPRYYHFGPSADYDPIEEGSKDSHSDLPNTHKLNGSNDISDSLHSEHMGFLDSLWKEMERLFHERPRHRDDPFHKETKVRLCIEEIASTVSWKRAESSQVLFEPTITREITLYTPVEATYEASTSATYDYLTTIGLQDNPVRRPALALAIPERKRPPGWI